MTCVEIVWFYLCFVQVQQHFPTNHPYILFSNIFFLFPQRLDTFKKIWERRYNSCLKIYSFAWLQLAKLWTEIVIEYKFVVWINGYKWPAGTKRLTNINLATTNCFVFVPNPNLCKTLSSLWKTFYRTRQW